MPTMSDTSDMVKIVLDGDPEKETATETVWAKEVAGEPGYYELQNIPIFAYGMALDDVVAAELHDDGRPHFVKVVRPSGILTVRVAGPNADREALEKLKLLLRRNAIAAEVYSATYVAYAMEKSGFAAAESEIDAICDDETLFVEIANDEVADY